MKRRASRSLHADLLRNENLNLLVREVNRLPISVRVTLPCNPNTFKGIYRLILLMHMLYYDH
jgi:hypothetical protein